MYNSCRTSTRLWVQSIVPQNNSNKNPTTSPGLYRLVLLWEHSFNTAGLALRLESVCTDSTMSSQVFSEHVFCPEMWLSKLPLYAAAFACPNFSNNLHSFSFRLLVVYMCLQPRHLWVYSHFALLMNKCSLYFMSRSELWKMGRVTISPSDAPPPPHTHMLEQMNTMTCK
jgi:hypothetical protein